MYTCLYATMNLDQEHYKAFDEWLVPIAMLYSMDHIIAWCHEFSVLSLDIQVTSLDPIQMTGQHMDVVE